MGWSSGRRADGSRATEKVAEKSQMKYESPRIVELGSIADLTRSNGKGKGKGKGKGVTVTGPGGSPGGVPGGIS